MSSSSTSVSSALAPYGWDDAWADAFAPHDAEGLLPGRVIRVDRGQCDVVTADGTLRADTAFVTPHDPLRVVCTGDWVAVEPDLARIEPFLALAWGSAVRHRAEHHRHPHSRRRRCARTGR